MNAMAIAYEAYMRNCRKLNGLELQLIRGTTTSDHAGDVVILCYVYVMYMSCIFPSMLSFLQLFFQVKIVHYYKGIWFCDKLPP